MDNKRKFFAENLRFLRQRQDISLRELSENVKVSHTMLNNYEKESAFPRKNVLDKIAAFFEVAPEDIISKALYSDVFQMESIDFRTTKDVFLEENVKTDLEQYIIKELENHLFIRSLLTHIKFKNISFEKFPLTRRIEIEQAAIKLRSLLGVNYKYFFNLPDILYDKGIIHIPIPSKITPKKLEGIVGKFGDLYYIATASETSEEKQRFTIAHELAHLFLDIHMKIIEHDYEYWRRENNFNAELYEPVIEEKICSEFAGAFLLPVSYLKKELGHKRKQLYWYELLLLHRRYKFSLEAVVIHSSKFKIIDYNERDRLIKFIDKMRKEGKIITNNSQVEKNNRFIQLVCDAVARRLLSTKRAAEILHFDNEEDFINTYFLDFNN